MTNEEYFHSLLDQQGITENQKQNMRNLRDKIEDQIKSEIGGSPRVLYGGSLKKHTMIRAGYDLDIVFYWPPNSYTLDSLYRSVGSILQKYWTYVHQKRVGWQIRFEGDFHIDIIPGVESSQDSRYAYLYNKDTGGRFQTSIDIQVRHIRKANRSPVIKLLKLWKIRKNVPIKTFFLENMIIEGCKGLQRKTIEPQLNTALNFIKDHIQTIRLQDPAYSKNIISDDISAEEKNRIKKLAKQAINAKTWRDVFQ